MVTWHMITFSFPHLVWGALVSQDQLRCLTQPDQVTLSGQLQTLSLCSLLQEAQSSDIR